MPMTDSTQETPDNLGHLDDDQEAAEQSSDDGAAARGEYDPAQGSPEGAHPTGEGFPDEAVRYDDPESHPRTHPDVD
jgi:hypothetical protein